MFLNVHSWYSFHYGVMKPDMLLGEAQQAGVRTFALTDINNTSGVSDFVRTAKDHEVRPAVGIEFRKGPRMLYIGIAKNNEGFRQLNELLTPHTLDGEPLPERAPEMTDAFVVYPFATAPAQLRPNERVGIRPTDLTRLPFSPWAKRPNDLVALMPVTFRHKRDHNCHRLLRTIAKNTIVSMLPPEELAAPDERFRNAEEARTIYRDHPYLLSNAEKLLEQCSIDLDHGKDKTREVFSTSMAADRELLHREAHEGFARRFKAPSQKAITRLAHELDVIERMGFISYFLINWELVRFAHRKAFFHVGRGSGANSLVAYCLGITDVDPIELDLYFERFISTARKKPPDFDIDFSWKDRDRVFDHLQATYDAGTGALRGRRFAQIATYTTFQWRGAMRELGKAVGLPPEEIDALSEGDHGYYGRGRASNAVRTGDLDKVAQAVVRYSRELIGMPHHFGIHAGGIIISEKPLTYYTSLHRPPKGYPVTQFSMLEAEDMGLHKFDILSQRGLGHIRDAVELVNSQFSMLNDQCSSAVDGTIGNCALNIDHSTFREAVDIHDIPRFKNDPKIKELLRKGDTIGCFYVESPAMRMLLKKLQVEDYPTLVAASSIIRPGVAESGMMREYILRHNDVERRKLAPKSLYDIMPETYGVMVYQEDVIRVAHFYAGLDLEESDLLRRGMTSRFRERPEFKAVQKKFFANCKAKGHPDAEAQEVWRQIESFASFSFAKGHSASYAVESYQSLYLKAYHPLEFMVAVANNFGGFYRTEFYLHEAKRAGATVEAPCVNESEELCSLHAAGPWLLASGRTEQPMASSQKPKARIYLGLSNIKSLNTETVQLLLIERRRNGPFVDLQDLIRRVPLHVEQARILIRSGAMRFTGRSKPALLWDLTLLHRGPSNASTDGDLFITKVEEPKLPELHHYPLADAYDELELLGFPLRDPFTMVEYEPAAQLAIVGRDGRLMGKVSHESTVPDRGTRTVDPPGRQALIQANAMRSNIGKRVTMLGYMIHVKTTTTNSGSYMSFGSFIDPAGDFWDSTQFPSVAERYPFRGRGVYVLTGYVEEEFGHCSLRTDRVEKLPWKPDPRYGE